MRQSLPKSEPTPRSSPERERQPGAPFPGFVQPCLATLQPKPPAWERWVHDIKHDGYRFQIHIRGGQGIAYSRRGHDWSHRVRPIVDAWLELEASEAILDGEVVVPNESGISDFATLVEDLGKGRTDRLVFYAFDPLLLDGRDLSRGPISTCWYWPSSFQAQRQRPIMGMKVSFVSRLCMSGPRAGLHRHRRG